VDPEAVIEEARQQLASNGSRRRRRGRGGGEGRGAGSESPSFEPSADNGSEHEVFAPIPIVEITPLPVAAFEHSDAELVTVEVPVHRSSAGRGGARSGRVAPIKSEPAAVATAVALEPQAATASEPEASEADDTGEPRRRRRRSSAAG
jgi:ribonuclease E